MLLKGIRAVLEELCGDSVSAVLWPLHSTQMMSNEQLPHRENFDFDYFVVDVAVVGFGAAVAAVAVDEYQMTSDMQQLHQLIFALPLPY